MTKRELLKLDADLAKFQLHLDALSPLHPAYPATIAVRYAVDRELAKNPKLGELRSLVEPKPKA